MKNFKKILLAITHNHTSANEIEQAIKLAKENDAEITLAAFDEPFTLFPYLAAVQDLKTLYTEQLEEMLAHFKEQIDAAGIKVSTRIVWGRSYLEIIRLVQEEGFDLVVKLADPFHVLGNPRLTGDDLSLMRKCPVPVWMLSDPERTDDSKHRILVCVDAEVEEESRQQLNQKLLAYGAHLAEQEQAELHTAHVWSLFGEQRMQGPFINMPPADMDNLLNETKDYHQKIFMELQQQAGVEDTAIPHLLKGSPTEEILTLVKNLNIDLIIIGTVGRTGLSGFIVGNTAETIMGNVHCSVLAVKPDGFKCPIKLQ